MSSGLLISSVVVVVVVVVVGASAKLILNTEHYRLLRGYERGPECRHLAVISSTGSSKTGHSQLSRISFRSTRVHRLLGVSHRLCLGRWPVEQNRQRRAQQEQNRRGNKGRI